MMLRICFANGTSEILSGVKKFGLALGKLYVYYDNDIDEGELMYREFKYDDIKEYTMSKEW